MVIWEAVPLAAGRGRSSREAGEAKRKVSFWVGHCSRWRGLPPSEEGVDCLRTVLLRVHSCVSSHPPMIEGYSPAALVCMPYGILQDFQDFHRVGKALGQLLEARHCQHHVIQSKSLADGQIEGWNQRWGRRKVRLDIWVSNLRHFYDTQPGFESGLPHLLCESFWSSNLSLLHLILPIVKWK